MWWTRRESNSQPSACKAAALPLRHEPIIFGGGRSDRISAPEGAAPLSRRAPTPCGTRPPFGGEQRSRTSVPKDRSDFQSGLVAVRACSPKIGGEGGIRTHGAREGSTVFKTVAFSLSATPPLFWLSYRPRTLCFTMWSAAWLAHQLCGLSSDLNPCPTTIAVSSFT